MGWTLNLVVVRSTIKDSLSDSTILCHHAKAMVGELQNGPLKSTGSRAAWAFCGGQKATSKTL